MLARGEVSLSSDCPPSGAIYSDPELPAKKPCHSVRSARYSAPTSATKSNPKQKQAEADPLFLFHCALQWHGKADTASGWELAQAMRFGDTKARALSRPNFLPGLKMAACWCAICVARVVGC